MKNEHLDALFTPGLQEWVGGECKHPLETGFSPLDIKGYNELDRLLWFYATASQEEWLEDSGTKALNYLVDKRGF